MPTFGYTSTQEDYAECLDLLHVIVQKYKDTHTINICGDMNATLLPTRRNRSDIQLRNFLKHEHFSVFRCSDEPTYVHGVGSSQIDYFLATEDMNFTQAYVMADMPCNTSSHAPVRATLNVNLSGFSSSDCVHTRFRKLWNRGSLHLYKQAVSERLCSKHISSDIEKSVTQIQSTLLQAESIAIPKKVVQLKGPKWKASPKSKQIRKKSLDTMKLWKDAGKPGPEHPLSLQRKSLKRELRSTHRQDLAMPKDGSHFDDNYKDKVEFDLHLIRNIVDNTDEDVPAVSFTEVQTAVSKLHNKKASDEFGLSAEHLKNAGDTLLHSLSQLFTMILDSKEIPQQFQCGVIHPIHKRGKDASLCTNYRGITVSSTIGKVFEHVILGKIEEKLP
ncbi:hypothetical protein FSP39_024644 [Pinctada imbricata]|uniref:Endonuclease/exonuclease/phosphatase domain-containing protein n=1 Tax=Pinctada imbricata TaxID=66713 RepID=A0AA89C596_PINIB|nr:hypothetical protein FSP39_024644 [Pinctada imbricata]